MMSVWRRGVGIRAGVSAAVLLLSGCALGTASQPTHFYRLEAPAPVAVTAQNKARPTLGLLPVLLPAYLDRVSLVTQVSPVRYDIPQLEQWAGDLRGDLQVALAGHLSQRLDNPNILLLPQPGLRPPQSLQVQVLRFDGRPGERLALVASWWLTGEGGVLLRQGQFEHSQPIESGYEALVRGMSAAVAALAASVAGEL
ncbi:MAG: PqiC family protein [Gammaproteobacteria bacterium]|nr:PqiC family protein [Gammaproteobacteria bacterium]